MGPGQDCRGRQNWSTWLHELVHEADYPRGNMVPKAAKSPPMRWSPSLAPPSCDRCSVTKLRQIGAAPRIHPVLC